MGNPSFDGTGRPSVPSTGSAETCKIQITMSTLETCFSGAKSLAIWQRLKRVTDAQKSEKVVMR